MSTQARALPPGWSSILDEMHARLDHAIASANQRIDQMPHAAANSDAHARHQEIAQWNDRLLRLSNYLEAAEQIVHSVDELLQREENHLRQQIAASESLRQKAS